MICKTMKLTCSNEIVLICSNQIVICSCIEHSSTCNILGSHFKANRLQQKDYSPIISLYFKWRNIQTYKLNIISYKTQLISINHLKK